MQPDEQQPIPPKEPLETTGSPDGIDAITTTPLQQPPVQQMPPAEARPPQEQPADDSVARKKDGGIFSFLATLLAAFVLVQLINMFLFQSYKVFGSSMHPTLEDGDRLIISKVEKTASRLLRNEFSLDRGDIVVFDDPYGSGTQLIKRVIGLPGERVVVRNGSIRVFNQEHPDGFNPDEGTDYEKNLPRSSGNVDVIVPKGHLFVSGDNREANNSLDSRNELGTLPKKYLVGTLSVRIFPFDQAEFF